MENLFANSDQIILKSSQKNSIVQFAAKESFAIQHLTGEYTVSQIQQKCQNKFLVNQKFTVNLLKKLIQLEILDFCINSPPKIAKNNFTNPHRPKLKSGLYWVNQNNVWILCNPENKTSLQVDWQDKKVIERIGKISNGALMEIFQIDYKTLNTPIESLRAKNMLKMSQA